MHARLLIAFPLLGLATAITTPVQAASKPPHVPVVATWFSSLHPKVGQHETVYVQFFVAKRHLSGAHLSATVQVGKHSVLHLKGTVTNRQGKAWATFTVPRQARGKKIVVSTSLTYKKRLYTGNNSVTVAR
jgi:hypothetical protein